MQECKGLDNMSVWLKKKNLYQLLFQIKQRQKLFIFNYNITVGTQGMPLH